MTEDVTTKYEAHSPGQLAAEIARADSIKLKFDEEVYPLTKLEIEWIVFALRAAPTISS